MKLNVYQTESTTNHDGTTNLVRLLQNLPDKQVIQTLNYAWIDGGQRLKEHVHTDCMEYYLFTSGIGEMTTGEEKIEVKRGDFVTVQAGEMHTVVNDGREKLEFVTLRGLIN